MRSLLIVDVQNDFCPGGPLAVPDGDRIVPIINRIQPHFDLVVASKDWHPADHCSFAVNHGGGVPGETVELDTGSQILWPVHCLQRTEGADFHPALDQSAIVSIFFKGTDPKIDSYSGFFDNGHRQATGLADYLKERGTSQLYVCGLATDYCVKYTALDALSLGFQTHLIEDACRGVNLKPSDSIEAIAEMRKRGAILTAVSNIGG